MGRRLLSPPMHHAFHVPRRNELPLTHGITPDDLRERSNQPPRRAQHARHLEKESGTRTLWLDASDLKVSGAFDRWVDKAGGRVFRQTANTSYRPLCRLRSQNGLSVADFTDGAFLTCEDIHTVGLVKNREGTLTFLARHVYQTGGGGCFLTDIGNGGMGFYMAQNTTAYYDHGPGGGAGTRLSFAITRDPDWCVYQLVKRGEEMFYYRDGVLLGSGTGKTGTLTNNKSYAILGHDNRTSSPINVGSAMDVAELRVYNRSLTADQLRQEREELARKWGLGYRYDSIVVPNTTAQWDASSLSLAIGANVTSWAAIVGGSSYTMDTVSGTNPTYQAKNSCPGVRYSGGYHRTNAATGLVQPMNNNDWSVFAVVGVGAVAGAYNVIVDHTHTTPSGQNFVMARHDSNNTWTCAYYRTSGGTVEALGPGGAVAWRGQGRMVLAMNKVGTAWSMRNGRRAIARGTAGATTYTSAARQLNFGGNPSFSRLLTGDIHEVILTNQGQEEQEVDEICARLARKWGAAL